MASAAATAVSNQQGTDQSLEGETTEQADKPPHETNSHHDNHKSMANGSLESSVASIATLKPSAATNGASSILTIPLPPPEADSYQKQPGHTINSLQKFVISTGGAPVSRSPASPLSPPSSPSSSSDDDHGHSDWSSMPPSLPPTQPPSRAPSMSSGMAGGKLLVPKKGVPDTMPTTPMTEQPRPMVTKRAASNPGSVNGATEPRPKPASVHSNDGDKDKHKFNLKDLLGAGSKITRRSSQRSAGSSRKSDTDRDSMHDGKAAPYARSAAGDSTTSLTQKYGVCQKMAIGKGATSVVRLAHKWDRTEEKLYAVKEFRKRRKNETEKEYVKKLTSEFCISSTLHHVNIVETVDLVQDENQKWCEVMEFCAGGDLYAAIKKGGMSPSEVECCFRQILSGMQYLHNQGVAHRDIKPENLFFDDKGHLKIGDYGASTVYRLPWEKTVHMSTGLCGSEPYIAPEQFLGKPYDARLVDIWAIGIVYYCLHFQELPWRAAQATDTLYQAYATACASSSGALSTCPPTVNNLSPRQCRPLIRKMLEPNPKLRWPIEEVMKHEWIESIEVCHEQESPKHVHVHATAMARQQLKDLRD